MISRRFKQKVKIEWSSDFAYAIGLITSDGWLHKDQRHIGFSSKEIELINKFKRALLISNKTIAHVRGGETDKKYLFVQFGDKIFYQFLNSIGLTVAKSKTIKQIDIPDRYFPDFLRGLFDGDGTFYTFWDKRWPKSFGFKTSFASASPDFIKWLRTELKRLYGLTGSVHKGVGVSNLEYTKGDSRKIFNVMYHRKDLLFLSRKYFKIKIALEQDKLIGYAYLQKPRIAPE
ncbi:MAG: LAGLIDADG family homing endonuclease [Candidatus Doudnabacteria bacterium]|nr:LAGLIDADG family homing endonuclease [Candidatus Doudnabacteria bacterium]